MMENSTDEHLVTQMAATKTTATATTSVPSTTTKLIVQLYNALSTTMTARPSTTSTSQHQVTSASSSVDDVITSLSTSLVTADREPASSNVGVAIGVAIAIVVLLIVIAAVILLIVRRRRVQRRNKSIVKIENPQYRLADNEDRAATLSTAPTVKFTANNNTASLSSTASNKKRKEAAPPPPNPIYRPPADNNAKSWDSLTKRKAAAPLPPLGNDLFGKDSPSVSVENVTSVVNTNAASPVGSTSPVDDSKDFQSAKSQTQPLLTSADSSKRLSTPKHSSSPQKLSVSDVRGRSGNSVGEDEDVAAADLTTSLIDKKTASNMSLDSYDRTKNPFFAD